MALLDLFRRKPEVAAGRALYGAAVRAARDPALFASCAIPDTLDGRFDVIGLHAALIIHRLRAEGDARGLATAQAVFDAMFVNMDETLREMGVGDLSVGRKVRGMWEAFHGRALAYEAALEAGDAAALAAALERNVWRGGDVAGSGAQRLAAHGLHLAAALRAQPLEALLRGEVSFPGLVDA